MATKQTAVEQLIQILKEREITMSDLLKAKETEYIQILDAYDGIPEYGRSVMSEDYYKKVYGD